jgi:archaetidylinositol phosphate synthase
VLENLRKKLSYILEAIGKLFSRTGLSPTAYTLIGFSLSILASYLYSTGYLTNERIAGLIILISGFFDVVDGSVARITGRVSQRGAFLDSNLDRLGEMFLFLGIIVGSLSNTIFSFIALSMSFMVSYTRARAEPLGLKLSGIGIGERSERLLILSVSSISGLVNYGVLLVAIVAGATFIQRLLYSAMKL